MSAKQDFPRPGRRPKPADRASMLRVDQAGEFGATRIYAGQLAVMAIGIPMPASLRAWPRRKNATARRSTR